MDSGNDSSSIQLWHANLFKDLRNPNEFGRFFIDLQ
jgi:hypothetical protein